jgi:hypothetical protein
MYSSFLYHSKPNTITYIIDQIAIVAVILYGVYVYFGRIVHGINLNHHYYFYIYCAIPPLCFLTVLWLFFYGKMVCKYCYDKDKKIADNYHSLIHIISSLGHNSILLL